MPLAGAQPSPASPPTASLTRSPPVCSAGTSQWAIKGRSSPSRGRSAGSLGLVSSRPALLAILWPLVHSRALSPWLRALRAARAASLCVGGGHGGPPYLLEQRAGIGGIVGRSSGSGSGGGCHGAWYRGPLGPRAARLARPRRPRARARGAARVRLGQRGDGRRALGRAGRLSARVGRRVVWTRVGPDPCRLSFCQECTRSRPAARARASVCCA